MKKLFISFVFTFAIFGNAPAFAPMDIKFTDIRKFATQKGAYENLMERMNAGEALTLTEYACLYYGYSFSDKYVFNAPPYTELAIYELTEKEQYMDAWAMCADYLSDNPFSMFALEVGVFLTDYFKDFGSADIYYKRSGHILQVIESTGDGSKEHPYQVIYPGDILYYLRFQLGVNEEETLSYENKNGRHVYEIDIDGEVTRKYFAFDLCRK